MTKTPSSLPVPLIYAPTRPHRDSAPHEDLHRGQLVGARTCRVDTRNGYLGKRHLSPAAPIQVAAQALICRRDERGARLIFRAIALGDDDASEHLLYFTAGSAELGEHAIWSHAQRSAESGDEIARRGALELLRYVGHPSITNPERSG
jgi:hypothetical protein